MSKSVKKGTNRNQKTQNEFIKNPPAVYRYISIGTSLRKSTDKLVHERKISKFLESFIVETFDMKMAQGLRKIHHGVTEKLLPIEFKAEKETNNTFIEGRWEIILENVVFNPLTNPLRLKKMRILADNYSEKSVDQSKVIQSLLKKK